MLMIMKIRLLRCSAYRIRLLAASIISRRNRVPKEGSRNVLIALRNGRNRIINISIKFIKRRINVVISIKIAQNWIRGI